MSEILETTGDAINDDENHWQVECPGCGLLGEYEGCYDEDDIVTCEHCQCKFKVTRVYIDGGYIGGRKQ